MRKILCIALGLILLLSLSACEKTGSPSDSDNPEETIQNPVSGVITDFKAGDVEVHEQILPWEFADGEEVDNPYYHRAAKDDGTPIYEVKKAANSQTAQLPMGQTIIYTGEGDNCYFEKVTNTFLLDGLPQEEVQYHLHITATAPEAIPSDVP